MFLDSLLYNISNLFFIWVCSMSYKLWNNSETKNINNGPKNASNSPKLDTIKKQKPLVYVTDINKIPINPKYWWVWIKEYKLTQYWNNYIFSKNWVVWIYNPDKKKYEQTSRQKVVDTIATLKKSKKEQANIKAEISQKNKNNAPRYNKENIVSDDELFDGLRGLIRKGNQSAIDAHLNRNASQYSSFVRSSTFQEKFTQAIENPPAYALIWQLYARFTLGDTSVVVDGKYGKQTSDIVKQYTSSSEVSEQRLEERKKRIETIINWDSKVLTKQEETTKWIVDKIVISEQDEYRYAKIFDLDDTTINSLTRNKEKKKKTPQQLAESYTSKRNVLFDIAKKSAKKWCSNYLQELFKQRIDVPGNPQNLEKMFDNLDLSNGVKWHEQSLDFTVKLDGKPFSMCYNVCDGELKYTPLCMKNEWWDLVKWSPSEEKVLIPKWSMPSLISMLTDAKSWAESAAKTEASNRTWVIAGIKSIEKAVPNLQSNQDLIANAVAQESCMQSFLDLTGYDLTQKLDKQTYGNTQLYMLHDMFQYTFNQPNINPVDIYRLRDLLERVKKLKNEYQDPTKIVKKNIRSEQFSEQKLKNDKSNILAVKADSSVDDSLSFYNFFSQYINPNITDPKVPGYRVLDINKIEADLNKAEKDKFLSDDTIQKTIVINEEKKEKETADDFLEKNWA